MTVSEIYHCKKKEFVEVYDLSAEFVQKDLQELIHNTLGSILVKKEFKFIVPSRSSTHTVFNDELCRRLLTRHEIIRSHNPYAYVPFLFC